MVSSTEIPNAMLKPQIVEGFIGTPMKPINPAVMSSGSKLGTRETRIIRRLLNIHAINRAIKSMANDNDNNKLFTKYFVPFSKTKAFPVIAMS